MRNGSLVRYTGDKKFPNGAILMVHAVNGDTVSVFTEPTGKGKWKTTNVAKKELEVIVE